MFSVVVEDVLVVIMQYVVIKSGIEWIEIKQEGCCGRRREKESSGGGGRV